VKQLVGWWYTGNETMLASHHWINGGLPSLAQQRWPNIGPSSKTMPFQQWLAMMVPSWMPSLDLQWPNEEGTLL
jgi:hypothetical protein